MRNAAGIVGGTAALARVLDSPAEEVRAWLDGTREPPRDMFLLCVDIIVDDLESAG